MLFQTHIMFFLRGKQKKIKTSTSALNLLEKQSASFQLNVDPVHKNSLTQQFTGGEDYYYTQRYHMASEDSK